MLGARWFAELPTAPVLDPFVGLCDTSSSASNKCLRWWNADWLLPVRCVLKLDLLRDERPTRNLSTASTVNHDVRGRVCSYSNIG